jgi:hypothetical protein
VTPKCKSRIHVVVLRVVTPCNHIGGFQPLKEHSAPVFTVEVCRVRMWLGRIGKLGGRFSSISREAREPVIRNYGVYLQDHTLSQLVR